MDAGCRQPEARVRPPHAYAQQRAEQHETDRLMPHDEWQQGPV